MSEASANESVHHLEAQRRANRDAVEALGRAPYGARTDGLVSLAEAVALHDPGADEHHAEHAKDEGFVDRRPRVRVAGRVMLYRDNGKLIWMNLRDATADLQVAVSKRDCVGTGFDVAKATDLGDLLVVEGPLMKTRAGEVTVWASSVTPASKCLVPPPEKHAGLADHETRYRRRYVDMWANPKTTKTFALRSRIVAEIRRYLSERGFLEVETPMLQTQAGGAAARPFVTHMNALDLSLFMRIAPELYLKRLLVGGMPRVFEINRNFRNEGLDKQHNPEFTMLELYEAFGNYDTVTALTEDLIRSLARTAKAMRDLNPLRKPVFGGGKYAGYSIGQVMDVDQPFIWNLLEHLELHRQNLPLDVLGALYRAKTSSTPLDALRPEVDSDSAASSAELVLEFDPLRIRIDYGKAFARVTYAELFERGLGFPMSDIARVHAEARTRGVKTVSERGERIDDIFIINDLFETFAEPLLLDAAGYGGQPVWIMDYPAQLSPLTRAKVDDPTIAERADLFIAGMEIGPHYTELNDPDIQAARFREQLAGVDDEESTFRNFDEDFVTALKVGMPPAGGMGLGIDRLMMLLANQPTIRDVILFPLMRPVGQRSEQAPGE